MVNTQKRHDARRRTGEKLYLAGIALAVAVAVSSTVVLATAFQMARAYGPSGNALWLAALVWCGGSSFALVRLVRGKRRAKRERRNLSTFGGS